jgi:hypothetical protein
MLGELLSTLQPPITQGSVGFFTLTLTWNGSGDVDLHTFEPSGPHVYYKEKRGLVGYLDVDNTSGYGPEHYYASCDPAVLKTGTYRIGINNYERATGRIATVQVSSAQRGEILTRTLDVGPVMGKAGDGSPLSVLTVTVTKDPVTGVYSATAQ